MPNKQKILITGITGQDGSYLVEDLLAQGHEVHGIIRRSSSINTDRIDHLIEDPKINGKTLFLHFGDVSDPLSVTTIISTVKPDVIYSLAAQSHVKVSFEIPVYTAQVDALGILYILEAVRIHCPAAKIYQASTSELYGGIPSEMPTSGFDEQTPFHPRSPYGVAKLYGFWAAKNYREAYDLHVSNGILFNHESPRRGETFVTRKITRWLGKNFKNLSNGGGCETCQPLELGNLDAMRDWGHAKDFVKAMQLIMEQDSPDDYVVATGASHSVREFLERSLKILNLNVKWIGEGIKEVGIINGKEAIRVNPKYYRPSEVFVLKGNPSKIKKLGWQPQHDFNSLVKDMVRSDVYSVK